ncbi:hypothetical protein PG988_010317 [Apiospora saccharicola]
MTANFPNKSFQNDKTFWRAVTRDRVLRVRGIDRDKSRDDFAAFLTNQLAHLSGHVEWDASQGRNCWCYVLLQHAGHVPQACQKPNGLEFGAGILGARKWEPVSPRLGTTDYRQFKKEVLSDYAQLATAYTNAGSDVVLHTDTSGEFLPMSFSRTIGHEEAALQSGVARRGPNTTDYKIVPMAEKNTKKKQLGYWAAVYTDKAIVVDKDGNDMDTRAPPDKGLDVRTTDQPTDDTNARFSPVASVLEKSAARLYTPGLAFFPSDPENSISTASQFIPPPEPDGLAGRHVPTDLPPLDWVPEGTPTLSFGNNGAHDKTFTADAKLREDAVRPGDDELSFTLQDKISSKGRKNAAAVGTNASQKKT